MNDDERSKNAAPRGERGLSRERPERSGRHPAHLDALIFPEQPKEPVSRNVMRGKKKKGAP
jgi:hypothetical protein